MTAPDDLAGIFMTPEVKDPGGRKDSNVGKKITKPMHDTRLNWSKNIDKNAVQEYRFWAGDGT